MAIAQTIACGSRNANPYQRAAIGVEVRPANNLFGFTRGRRAVAIIKTP
jgi:hypothetical protein